MATLKTKWTETELREVLLEIAANEVDGTNDCCSPEGEASDERDTAKHLLLIEIFGKTLVTACWPSDEEIREECEARYEEL